MFTVINDVLHSDGRPVPFLPTVHVGGRIVPTAIVMHDTAGRLDKSQSAKYLQRNPAQVSAHLVIERDGSVTQLARLDVRTNHAGRSSWRGRDGCNGFAIGIEIVNPGRLDRNGVSWFGVRYEGAVAGASPAHKAGWWLPYTDVQVQTVTAIVAAIRQAYPSVLDVVGHHDVSPGRKEDPTPLFPWHQVRAALPSPLRAHEDSDELAEIQQRLDDLGYPVGMVDGRAGRRTSMAIFAFQGENGLAATGDLDAATARAILSDGAKPLPTGHREGVTPQALAQAGDPDMREAFAERRDGGFQAVLAATTGTLAVFKSTAETIGTTLLIVGVCGVAAYFGLRAVMRGNSQLARGIRMFVTGRK